CGFGSIDNIYWCYWLFVTSGPNWLLGGKNCNRMAFIELYLHTFVLPLLTAIFMLMHFLKIRQQGLQHEVDLELVVYRWAPNNFGGESPI
ncbi:hypothetical protein MIMGU_mgv11b022951mg, partial [Erythranthe guttata]